MSLRELIENRRTVITGILILTVLMVFIASVKNLQKTPGAIETDEKGKSKGPRLAKIQIVEYSDFQCPACKKVGPIINKIFSDFPGKVRMVYRHFPLSGHQWAPMAHQAAECAARENNFWEYHDKLYGEQEKWTVMANPMEAFIKYAQELKLNAKDFASCMANGNVTRDINNEKEEGAKRQVHSTPTFFINGKRFVGNFELQIQGDAFIRQELKMTPPESSVPAPAAATQNIQDLILGANQPAPTSRTLVSGNTQPAPVGAATPGNVGNRPAPTGAQPALSKAQPQVIIPEVKPLMAPKQPSVSPSVQPSVASVASVAPSQS